MKSIWSQSCKIRGRECLPGNLEVEAVIIGAGMTGILTAFTLQEAGCQVVVLDAGQIGSGQTRNTTAKIPSQRGMIYQKLVQTLGMDAARQYAQANQSAVSAYETIIKTKHIDCDFEERSAYVYGNDTSLLQEEAQAAAGLGLPASFVTDQKIPAPAVGAVKFEHQAQFHPLKFLKSISDGLTIYEHTPVQNVEGGLLTTPYGTVKAKHIVFACHFPFINVPGMYFARMHQERSYVLALANAPQVDGMYISAEEGAGPSETTKISF